MKGFLFNEKLPINVKFTPCYPIIHVSQLGQSLSDTTIWSYAQQHDLAIVTKDADFSDRFMVEDNPATVVHLRFGNLRKKEFHHFLAKIWDKIEEQVQQHKLIRVYMTHIEIIQ